MKRLKFLLLVFIALIMFSIIYYVTYNFVEPKGYDFMVSKVLNSKFSFDKNKQIYGSDDIVLVVIDSKTVERYRWPWKREQYADIFEYLNKYSKPKVIFHDALIATLDKDYPESDKKYFKTINKYTNFIVGYLPSIPSWEHKEDGELYDKEFGTKYGIQNVEYNLKNPPHLYKSFLKFPHDYMNVIKYSGSVAVIPSLVSGNLLPPVRQDVIRNQEYIFKYGDYVMPSVAMRVFMMVNNNPRLIVNDNYMEFPELNYKIKHTKTNYQTTVPIRYYTFKQELYTHNKFSAVDVIDSYYALENGKPPKINPKEFEGKIVLVGANVPAGAGLNDNKNSPIVDNHPGVDIQATVIDNILHRDFLYVVPIYVNIILTILGMLCIFYFVQAFNLFKATVVNLIFILAFISLTFLCFYFKIVVNVVIGPVMFFVAMIVAYIRKYITEYNKKEQVKSIMGKYMSEDVMEDVLKNIDSIGLGGKKSTATILFSDIRGFTSLSENLPAQQVSSILNEYFSAMEPIIRKYNGIINKFIGDAIMAVFGEPIKDEMHASNAVRCAYEMLVKLEELNNKWASEGKPTFDIGVGINTGEVFIGNIGSENRMEYTVIGDSVNLASRLEGYNKTYKTRILISPTTYEKANNIIESKEISNVEIRGRVQKINIYEVIKVIG